MACKLARFLGRWIAAISCPTVSGHRMGTDLHRVARTLPLFQAMASQSPRPTRRWCEGSSPMRTSVFGLAPSTNRCLTHGMLARPPRATARSAPARVTRFSSWAGVSASRVLCRRRGSHGSCDGGRCLAPPRNGSQAFGRAAAPALREGPLWRKFFDESTHLGGAVRSGGGFSTGASGSSARRMRARFRVGRSAMNGDAALATRGPSTSRMMAVDVAWFSAWRCVVDRRVR